MTPVVSGAAGQRVKRAGVRSVGVLAPAFRLLERVVPHDQRLAVIGAFPDFDDSTRAVVPGLLERGLKVVVLVARSHDGAAPDWLDPAVVVRRRRSVGGFWCSLRARYVFHTHGSYIARGGVRNRLSINLWHGMPVKKLGLAIAQPGVEADVTIATSERFADLLAESFGMPRKGVLVLGLPRNDILVGDDPRDREAAHRITGGAPFVLYLPTFRRSVQGELRTDGDLRFASEAAARQIAAAAGASGYRIVLKPHPMADRADLGVWASLEGVNMIDDLVLSRNATTLHGLLSQSAGLISDFSSVSVDYLVTGRPICLYIPDLAEYAGSRGLNFGVDELAQIGTVTADADGVAAWFSTLADRAAHPPPPDFYSAPLSGATARLLDDLPGLERRLRT